MPPNKRCQKPKKNISNETRNKMSLSHGGEKNIRAKLNYSNVTYIRAQLQEGISIKELAYKFNVTSRTIKRIWKNEAWKLIPAIY